MARIGVNMMAWSGSIGPETMALFQEVAALGFDGVEVPLFAPEAVDAAAIRAGLRDAGLAGTISTALPGHASLLQPETRAEGVAFLRRCLEAAAVLGAEIVCGPLYHPVGALSGAPRTAAEWASAIRCLREVGSMAETLGVRLAIEPLNRFETFFLTTAGDARLLAQEIDRPAVGLLLDTFHMNIEETSFSGALAQAGTALFHVHCAENNRGVVGSGHIPWGEVMATLRSLHYDGWLMCETFSSRLPELAAAAAIWRPLFPDATTYARESLRFLRAALHDSEEN